MRCATGMRARKTRSYAASTVARYLHRAAGHRMVAPVRPVEADAHGETRSQVDVVVVGDPEPEPLRQETLERQQVPRGERQVADAQFAGDVPMTMAGRFERVAGSGPVDDVDHEAGRVFRPQDASGSAQGRVVRVRPGSARARSREPLAHPVQVLGQPADRDQVIGGSFAKDQPGPVRIHHRFVFGGVGHGSEFVAMNGRHLSRFPTSNTRYASRSTLAMRRYLPPRHRPGGSL